MPDPDHTTLHLTTVDAWGVARTTGEIRPTSLADEGFVHCTDTLDELVNVGNRYYAGVPGRFVALSIHLGSVRSAWRYDDPAEIYPHVYGPIPLAAVIGIRPMPRGADGSFLPHPEVQMNALEPLLDRLTSAGARLAATRQAVEAGSPWPVGAMAAGGAEGEWGPTEVLAHVSEMLPYWLGELERILAGADGRGGGGPAAFGRGPDDQVRPLTVTRDATLPVRELYDRIAAALQRYRWRLTELTAEEIARTGLHPTRGELSLTEALEQLSVSHLEGHAEQLEAALG